MKSASFFKRAALYTRVATKTIRDAVNPLEKAAGL